MLLKSPHIVHSTVMHISGIQRRLRLFRSIGFAPNVWHGKTTNKCNAVPGVFSKSAHGQRGWTGQRGITIMRVLTIKADASFARVSRRPPSLLEVWLRFKS